MTTLEENTAIIVKDFSLFGIKIEPIRQYFSPQEAHHEFEIISLPSIAAFNRAIKMMKLMCDLSCEMIGAGQFRLSAPCNRQYIGVGNCEPSLTKAVSADENGVQKGYICFGKGNFDYIVTSMEKAAHILVAGTTGSGKSCLLNSLIIELLAFSSAQLILIDPKQGVEFGIYEQDVHRRICSVAKNVSEAVEWLSVAVKEMERRYAYMKGKGLKEYDGVRLVVVIDELADLMMTSKNTVEDYIVRLAQMGRAAGVHLIVATQDPRASVVTGLIKYNLPTKVCLKTANARHSMNVIDVGKGAELLGKGDAYVKLPTSPDLMRCQCPTVSQKTILELITRKGE